MPKQKRRSAGPKNKRPKKRARTGYSTVPRTRGVYAKGEMKYFDAGIALTAIPSVAAWTGTEFDPVTLNTLCVPTVGAAINQRIGREVKVMKIKIRGHIVCASQSGQAVQDNPTQIRLALVQDMQTNATQAQGEQVFTPTSLTDTAPLTFQNIDNFGRFKVLKDKSILIQNPNSTFGATVSQCGLITQFKMNVNFRVPVSVRFNATNGGTVADIVDNSFHVMANSSSVELVPQLAYLVRVCYKE